MSAHSQRLNWNFNIFEQFPGNQIVVCPDLSNVKMIAAECNEREKSGTTDIVLPVVRVSLELVGNGKLNFKNMTVLD